MSAVGNLIHRIEIVAFAEYICNVGQGSRFFDIRLRISGLSSSHGPFDSCGRIPRAGGFWGPSSTTQGADDVPFPVGSEFISETRESAGKAERFKVIERFNLILYFGLWRAKGSRC
jgi:hypothetical protein